jgi:membrane-associated phospholipid phosphatase
MFKEQDHSHAHRLQPNLASVIRSHFWFKFFGIPSFIAVLLFFYIYLLKNPAFPVVVMPLTMLDTWIGFQPVALPVYVSLWIYVALPVMLMQTHREIIRYGCWIAGLCLIALGIFYFYPNAVPPANIDWSIYPGFAFLKNVDAAGNACPSLHVGTAVFTGIWLHHLMGRFQISPLARWGNALWCVGIAYSTLATKQHVAVDMLAGAALGALIAWFSLQPYRK